MHLVERVSELSLDAIEAIEKLTLRWIFYDEKGSCSGEWME
jgi:hypothetical protein